MIVDNVHKFITRHPAYQRVFPGWASDQLMWHLAEAVRDQELYVCTEGDMHGEISGVIIARIDNNTHEIRVSSIITNRPGSFEVFIRKWMVLYPDYTVVGRRSDKIKRYTLANFQRLLNHERVNPVSC